MTYSKYSHDDLIRIVFKELEDCGNDKDKIAERLMELAEKDPDLMLALAEHGLNIVRALAEKVKTKGMVH